jgi:hypothetical protein
MTTKDFIGRTLFVTACMGFLLFLTSQLFNHIGVNHHIDINHNFPYKNGPLNIEHSVPYGRNIRIDHSGSIRQ